MRGWRRNGRRVPSCALLLAAALAVLGPVGSATASDAGRVVTGPVAGQVSEQVSEQSLRVPVKAEAGGAAVDLDVSIFTGREATGRRPAVVLAHGFGGSKRDLAAWARTLARRGYVALAFTARGFGRSGGLIHLSSLDYEIADGRALVDLLAKRPDVLLDAPGDPRVGVAGGSYGGALALMLAGTDPRVDAAVPAITWHDLGQALFPQSAQSGPAAGTPAPNAPIEVPGVFKQRWASLFFAAGAAPGASGVCGRFAPEVCAAYTSAASSGRPNSRLRALLTRSSPAAVLSGVQAPTLLVQGEADSLFGLEQADANARGIAAAGAPVAVRWVAGGHDATGAEGESLVGLEAEALTWFGRHLRRDGSPADTTFRYAVPPASTLGQDPPVQRVAPGYPGLAGRPPVVRQQLPLSGGEQSLVSPPGGSPASITGLPGTGAVLGAVAGNGGLGSLGVLPGQSATFTSEPFGAGLTVVGSSRVRLRVASTAADASLFVGLWDVGPDGSAVLPQQLVAPVRLEGLRPGAAREIEVALPAIVRTVVAGRRLQVVVSSTDQAYAVPTDARAYQVALVGGTVAVPTVVAEVDTSTGQPLAPAGLVAAVGLLLLAVVAALLWRRRGRRRVHREPDLADAPLVVDGLTKTYKDGQLAVDNVSWRAERGQVVGLLGPNGAGKTTTLRMVVGLVRPDAGTVHVQGWPVTAGAPVLGEVGALLEGPGFLPHLTGRENLQAYWAATGRPADEAHLDEALAVADLGAAIDRRAGAYSQGMRQRLGIAQALLGRPQLLLLDEPTNGLDPPQILAMRSVLRDYAATGRTVVVSSHLLSEVEQTCSHVVVMDRGRVVTAGSVADLVGTGDTVLQIVGTEHQAAAAAELLSRLPGVHTATAEPGGSVRVQGAVPGEVLVRRLVEGGFEVASVGSRRHLEEVLLQLVAGS